MHFCQRRPLPLRPQGKRPMANVGGLKALLLSDHSGSLGGFRCLLEALGFHTRTTRSPCEAIRLMVERSFDLIVLCYDDQEIIYTLQDVMDALQIGRRTSVLLLTEHHVREGRENVQVLSKWADVESIVVAIGRACC